MVKNYLQPDKGLYFYFRTSCIRMQERFSQLVDNSDMPKVFLHGNPHLDNYVKTENGAAMIDFDRSRFGPYAWDIVRLLASISLKKAKSGNNFLSGIVKDYLYEGYIRSFTNDTLPHKQASELDKIRPQKWQRTINDYLKANNGWAKKLNENRIPNDDPRMLGVLQSYLESRNENNLLEQYTIEKAAFALGTLQNKRFLVLLKPIKETMGKVDRILLDIKSVYQDADNDFYYNPFEHHGIRMIKAAELYAPEIEERLGYATYQGIQYWGRAIPSFSYKIKTKLSETQQLDIAYSVGTQLGKAHRKSLVNDDPARLVDHLEKNYNSYIQAAEVLSKEIQVAHRAYRISWRKNSGLKSSVKAK